MNQNYILKATDSVLQPENRGFAGNPLRKLLLTCCLLITTVSAIAQNINVTGANSGNGSYATLGAAITAIGTSQSGANIIIEVVGNTTETASTISIGAGNWATMTIRPGGGASRIITAATTAGSAMIDFNGADNVTINGLNIGGNSLTISNTTVSATSATSTIRFLGGATNNTITNCSILGSSNMAVGTNGGNIFFSTDGVTANGNDNNTISNNNIGPAGSNLPSKGIYLNGSTSTTAIGNSGNIITNNNIFNYFGAATASAGVYVSGGNTDNTISNNNFYQTATRTQTTGTQHSAIWFTNTSGFITVTGNKIGFSVYASATGTGTVTAGTGSGMYTFSGVSSSLFIPIFINAETATASNINSNTIAAIAVSGSMSGTATSAPFRGIYINTGLANCNSNTIGNMSATGSITYTSNSSTASDVVAIYNGGSSAFTSNNNNIGGITVANSSTGATSFYALRCNTISSVTWTCNNNIIGGTIANSINSTSTATGTIVNGIRNEASIGTFTSNIIRNLTAAGGTGTTVSASVIGICISNSINSTLSQNTIFNLSNSNTSAESRVSGIQFTGASANTVERNFIYGLTAASTSTLAEVTGIRVAGGTTTYKNNIIALGAGLSTSAFQIYGINEQGGTNNFYNNSIYIGGNPTSGGSSSQAFSSSVTSNTRIFRNNIFVNNRSNNGATGKHFIVRVGGTTVNPTGLTINNNIYFGNGTGNIFGTFNGAEIASLTAWKTAVGQDAASFNANPEFLDPTNAIPDLHINPSVSTLVEASGVAIAGITDDFDGQTRSGLTPNDIGADAGNFMAASAMAYVSSTTTQQTGNVCSSASTIPVIRMEVVTTGLANALTLSSLTFNANGTSALADINTYRVYYTGTSSTFSTANPINAATAITSGSILVTPASTVTLEEGNNYFWLVYNSNTVVTGPSLDAEFTSVALSAGGGTPTVTAPAGNVTLYQTPIVVATNNGPVCVSGSLELYATTIVGATYAWTGPNNFTSTLQNPIIPDVAAVNNGTYSVIVTSNGCTSIPASTIVVVNSLSPAPVTTGINICTGGTFPADQGLISTAVTTASQTISFNVAGQPTETNSSPGSTVATATMAALPAGATITQVVISYPGITALSPSLTSDVRIGLSGALVNTAAADPLATSSAGLFNYSRTATSGITFTPAGGNVNLLYWDNRNDNVGAADASFPTGNGVASVTVFYTYSNVANVNWYNSSTGGDLIGTGSPFNPIGLDPALPNSNTPGSYIYYAQVNSGNCYSSRTPATLVIGAPFIVETSANPSTPVCAGTSIALSSTASGSGSAYTYSWKVGATEVSTLASFNATPAETTTYDLTVTDACMNTRTSSVIVTIKPIPVVQITPASVNSCGQNPVVLTASGADTYVWSPATGLNATTGASVTANPTSTTTYTVIGTTNGCVSLAKTVTVTVNPVAVTSNGATICPGESGSVSVPAFINSGTTISGAWTGSSSMANRPATASSMNNTDICSFSTIPRRYTSISFQVSVTGNYIFEMNDSGSYDGIGYIVTGAFTPGSCTTGTWIKGDDDGGSTGDEPLITASLTAGVTYQLISTTFSTTPTSSFAWTITPPATGQIMLPSGIIQWYDAASGGNLLYTGNTFNPVGIDPMLPNTNTQGSYTYYAASATNTTCRTATNLVINAKPSLTITSTANTTNNSESIPLAFTFSTAVTGFDSTDIVYTNGTVTNLSGNGTVFTATLTPVADGPVNVAVAANSAFNVTCGNTSGAFSYTSDRTRPNVSITSSASSPTEISPIPLTVTFSEPVTGFTLGDLTLTNPALGSFTNLLGSGSSYTVDLVPTGANGNRFINIAQNTSTDATGNGNTAAAQFSIAYLQPCSQATTWNGMFWTGGAPSQSQPAIIAGDYNTDFDLTNGFSACNLFIGNNAQVIIGSGAVLTIKNNVTVQSGSSLIFENGAILMQDVAATANNNTGNIVFKRNATMHRFDYVYWGSPVENQNLGNFSPWTVQPQSPYSGAIGASRFYDLTESTNSFAVIAQPTTVLWPKGKGFMVRAPNNFPTNGNAATFFGEFTGRPNNGTITVPISWSASNRGYNMIGNPYPSPLSADAFLAGTGNAGTLYFWTHFSLTATSGDNYGKYNSSGYVPAVGDPFMLTEGQTMYIAPGQGFILRKANANHTEATFTNAMRRDSNNAHFFRSSESVEKHRIWLNLSDDASPRCNQALVAYIEGATQGADEMFDGTLYYNGSSITSAIAGDTKKYVIQGRALPFDASDVVPLIFKAETDGTYKLSIDHVDGLFEGDQNIFLKDNLTGIAHDIKGSPYTFASVAGTFSDRFAIVYQSTLGVENPALDENTIVVYKKDNVLNVHSGNVTMSNVKLFDMRGRMIYEKSGISGNATSLNDLRAEQQVLLLQITSDNNKTVTKKVVY